MKSFLIVLCAATAASLAACDSSTTQKKLADTPTAGPFSPANAATPPQAKAPETDPNSVLASRVKQALEGMHIEGIEVVAADGAITLWGATASAAERKHAEAAAVKIEGVKSVDNKLIVVKGS
jgi:osmotically-inducible protein OsmY